MTTENNPDTQPEHWEEWFEKCALAKCEPEAQNALSSFAYHRYKKYLKKALSEKKQPQKNAPPELIELIESSDANYNGVGRCWHDLEASVWYQDKPTEPNKPNKTYKKFYRSIARFKAIETTPEEARNYLEGAITTYLIRTRCRKILKEAIFRKPSFKNEDGNVIEREIDLLGQNETPQPPANTPLEETENKQIAQSIFHSLTDDEKFFIYAFYQGINLDTPAITDFFKRKKSALYERQHRIILSLKEKIINNELNITTDYQAMLAILQELRTLLENWIKNTEYPYTSHLK